MEVMDTSLDKFYEMIYPNGKTIPEEVLGKIAVSVSMALGNALMIKDNIHYYSYITWHGSPTTGNSIVCSTTCSIHEQRK